MGAVWLAFSMEFKTVFLVLGKYCVVDRRHRMIGVCVDLRLSCMDLLVCPPY